MDFEFLTKITYEVNMLSHVDKMSYVVKFEATKDESSTVQF